MSKLENEIIRNSFELFKTSSNEEFELYIDPEIDLPSGKPVFTAVLKNNPQFTESLDSLEVKARISPEAYDYYRSHLLEKSTIETEQQLVNHVVENFETYYKAGLNYVVIGLSGMSGSGKSTLAREVRRIMSEKYGEQFAPVILSTDDYHRGRKYLESTYGAPWQNWDDPRVYNTQELAEDLKAFGRGERIIKKHFDFDIEEPALDDIIEPRPFVLVEGLFADSPDLDGIRHAHFEVPVSPVTALGRDIRRLVSKRANNEFSNPEARLKYQLETGLPTYIESRSRPRNFLFRSLLDASRLVEKPSL